MNTLNAYELLNVAPTASRDEIRAAYRDLARRWHPDRFMAGPERDWANNRMADINAAYRACLDGLTNARGAARNEDDGLRQAQQLIDDGMYSSARKKLMGLNTRCAEWNFLFGYVLMQQSEIDKALIYLSVAVHQNPDSLKYARALREAERLNATARLDRLLRRR
ncbi:MAG: J domain-containing protein [Clostridia bacterium]|nr:J domain-containing protein [Clostridia bacterium]